MKPRIFSTNGGWWCVLGMRQRFGATPRSAYTRWVEA